MGMTDLVVLAVGLAMDAFAPTTPLCVGSMIPQRRRVCQENFGDEPVVVRDSPASWQ